MTDQKKKISQSVDFLKANSPFKQKCEIAVISYKDPFFLKGFKILKRISFKDIPTYFEFVTLEENGQLLFGTYGHKGKNVIFINGRFYSYQGFGMRDIAHPVYVLKELGVKMVIFIDEVGFLNPRFQTGGLALIYDHINLMGDNPLIGENDNTLGPRFPDMSDAYDSRLFAKIENILINEKFKYFPSVYLGITGPETETEAECRFYRDIGADILGYGLVPENLAAVHSGLRSIAFGMISRELVADRLREIDPEVQSKNRIEAERAFAPILLKIINSL
jgi:purine-nucleoside phosphorylase